MQLSDTANYNLTSVNLSLSSPHPLHQATDFTAPLHAQHLK